MYEHRWGKVRTSAPRLRTREEMASYTGYTSMYRYLGDAQELIAATESTRGMKGLPVASDILYIDVDASEEVAMKVKRDLIAAGHIFEMYSSGSPGGFHFHIPIVEMVGGDVPEVQKQYVKETYTGVDMSLYSTSHVIRMAGTYHESNPGCCKHLLYSHTGTKLDLTEYSLKVQIDMPIFTPSREVETDLSTISNRINSMIFTPVSKGDRHMHLFRMASMCKETGLSYEDTLSKLLGYNNLLVSPPKREFEIVTMIRSVYKETM